VTGANRGIGVEVCRQLAERGMKVVLTSRDLHRGEAAARGLNDRGLDVLVQRLDVADPASVMEFAGWARANVGHVDVLVNNAAIDYDTDQRAIDADLNRVERAWQTNTLGAWRVTLALLPLLRGGTHVRIVNVSSQAGSISGITGGTPGYRVTKAALNALTRTLAAELRSEQILVNAVCQDGRRPTWVVAVARSAKARQVSSGLRCYPTAARRAGSSATDRLYRGERCRIDRTLGA
jgi:NAD(P)-dependent dehydrogenase (short-subunit alcohol dehydrogenase family)